MKTKEKVIKEFNDSLEGSAAVRDIVFKRLLLEILADLRPTQEKK